VGRYISPTIYSYRERIQINEEYIPQEALVRLTERIKETGEQMLKEGFSHPTMFEAETALSFLWFAEQNCDLVVLETGMGGKTDATNVIHNTLAAVLVSVSMDHMGLLGNTLGEIAAQKAGIIKPGCTVVTAKQYPEAEEVVYKAAKALGCPVVQTEPGQIVKKSRSLHGQTFDYKEWKDVEISLAGEYQFLNAALSLEVIGVLREKGYDIPDSAVYQGLKQVVWNGRFTVIAEDPCFIIDGAHNRDAAMQLRQTIEQYLQGKRLIFIMGVLADKEYDLVARQTAPLADEIITVMTPDNPRALPAEALAETVAKYQPHVQAAKSLGDAVKKAYALAGKEDVILAFGSLSYLGALTREVEKRR
jgi:dihydrofolate synthase/folylpolyglutamate synthase